jgi:hypothetical protein
VWIREIYCRHCGEFEDQVVLLGGTLCSLIASRQIPLRPLSEDTFVRIFDFGFSKLSRIRLKLWDITQCRLANTAEDSEESRASLFQDQSFQNPKDWAITLLRDVDDLSSRHGIPSQKTWIIINTVRASDLSLAVDIPLWQVLNTIFIGHFGTLLFLWLHIGLSLCFQWSTHFSFWQRVRFEARFKITEIYEQTNTLIFTFTQVYIYCGLATCFGPYLDHHMDIV